VRQEAGATDPARRSGAACHPGAVGGWQRRAPRRRAIGIEPMTGGAIGDRGRARRRRAPARDAIFA